MKKLILISAFALMQASCASMTYVEEAVVVNGNSPLSVTTQTDQTLSDDHFTVVDFALQNRGDDWFRIKEVQYKLENADHITVVVGKDLGSWLEGKTEELKVHNYNTDMILGGVSLLAVGALTSSNKSVSNAGAGALLGAAGFEAFRELKNGYNAVTGPQAVPTTHILAETTVAPGQVLRRWILFKGQHKEIPKYGQFKFITVDGHEYVYSVCLNENYNYEHGK